MPAGVLAPVVTSSVLDEPEATLDGVNVALAPVGRPVADSATVWPLPIVVAVLMVLLADSVGSAAPLAGVALMVKPSVGGARQFGSVKELTRVDQLKLPDALRYSVENQNVQSSVGSMFIVA